MIRKYGTIQEDQFYEDRYPATQDILLCIKPASENYIQLNRSLANQFHRLYVKSKNISDISGFDGIVLVDSDVELMSSTLAHFASALKEGYDFIYSDAAYGGMAETEILYPDKYTNGYRINFAVISKALAAKIAQHSFQSVTDLIAISASESENPCHINRILLNYRKPLTADDLFAYDKKHALIFCHEFSLTGAPIVLSESVDHINDYDLFVMGTEKDVIADEFSDKGIPVILNNNARKACDVTSIAFSFDLVVANTITTSEVVNMLSGSDVPVMWWLHDNPLVYTDDIYSLSLHENINIFCVSDYAQKCFSKYQPQIKTTLLPYAVTDRACSDTTEPISIPAHGKVLFASIGSINSIKGQDLLCDAIELLPEKVLNKCLFYFLGAPSDKKTFSRLSALCEKFPENVVYGHTVPHDIMPSVFRQTDCLICSSRYDPLPVFITEGWMFGKFCLCSKNTGTASYIKNGLNGYIIDPENAAGFADYITRVVKEKIYKDKKVAESCRTTYINNFTPEIFSKNIKAAIHKTADYSK